MSSADLPRAEEHEKVPLLLLTFLASLPEDTSSMGTQSLHAEPFSLGSIHMVIS